MSIFTQRMLASITESNIDVSPETLVQMWDVALKSQWDLPLVNLAGREDMPKALEEKVKKYKNADVQIAYMLRKNLPLPELKLTLIKEKRSAVLAGVLKDINPELISSVDSIFLKHYLNKPTAAVAEAALSRHTKISDDLSVAIIYVLGQRLGKLTDTLRSDWRRLVEKVVKSSHLPKAIGDFPDHTIVENAKKFLQMLPDNEVLIKRVHNIMVEEVIAKNKQGNLNVYSNELVRNLEQIVSVRNPKLNELIIKSIKGVKLDESKYQIDLDNIYSILTNNSSEALQKELDDILKADKNTLLTFINRAINNQTLNSLDEILMQSSRNPNIVQICVEDRYMINNYGKMDNELTAKLCKLPAQAGLIKALYLNDSSGMAAIDNFEVFGGIEGGVKFFSEFLSQSLTGEDKILLKVASSYNISYHITNLFKEPSHLKMLPFETIENILNGYNFRDKSIQLLLLKTFEELANDQEHWDTFSSLSQNYHGTLEGLIVTSKSI